jgi:hypothetical protein
VPAHTPAEIVDKLNREINAGLVNPEFKERLNEQGGVPVPTAIIGDDILSRPGRSKNARRATS